MVTMQVNGVRREIDVDPATPLLWVIREQLQLTGTKYGWGIARCGACTIPFNGQAMRSCTLPVSAAQGAQITTIEGLADGEELHPVQQAWVEEQVPQCGYCQSGQIMSAVALLDSNPSPTDADINRAMDGNVCRCGMYQRIRKAIKRAAGEAVVQSFDPAGENAHG